MVLYKLIFVGIDIKKFHFGKDIFLKISTGTLNISLILPSYLYPYLKYTLKHGTRIMILLTAICFQL